MKQRWMQDILILCLVIIAVLIMAGCGGNLSPTSGADQATIPANTAPLVAQPTNPSPATQASFPTDTQVAIPTQESAPQVTIDPCALITKDEAEKAVGSPVKDPKAENYPPLYGCKYEAADSINQVSISLVVFDNPEQALETYNMVVTGNGYEEVSGIGDRAFRPAILDIDVQKGRYDLSIGVINNGGDDNTEFEKAKELAVLALDRLP